MWLLEAEHLGSLKREKRMNHRAPSTTTAVAVEDAAELHLLSRPREFLGCEEELLLEESFVGIDLTLL